MWKILTAQIRGEIYYSIISRGLFHEEQKGATRNKEEHDIYYAMINTKES